MSTYWFRPKRYGYGATPVTWQGWALTLGGAAIIAAVTVSLMGHRTIDGWFALAIAIEVGVIVALVVICRRKTDGDWRWRWGDRS